MLQPRIVRVADFVAEELEREASLIPDGYKSRRDVLLDMAKGMRDSTNPRTIRVWEEKPSSATKKYLLIGPPVPTGTSGHHVLDSRMAIEWVEDPDKATADYEQSMKQTQSDLTDLGIQTEVEASVSDRQYGKYILRKVD
jgi:hypothetical protein